MKFISLSLTLALSPLAFSTSPRDKKPTAPPHNVQPAVSQHTAEETGPAAPKVSQHHTPHKGSFLRLPEKEKEEREEQRAEKLQDLELKNDTLFEEDALKTQASEGTDPLVFPSVENRRQDSDQKDLAYSYLRREPTDQLAETNFYQKTEDSSMDSILDEEPSATPQARQIYPKGSEHSPRLRLESLDKE